MKLKYITCAGVNEHTDIEDLFKLYAEFPIVEFGIQVSGRKCNYATPRWAWLKQLYAEVLNRKVALPLALHLNQDWVLGFCNGQVPAPLQELLSWNNHLQKPMFQRVQLNFKIGRDPKPDFMMLENMIKQHGRQRFIFSYNDANALFINNFHARNGAIFDCVYDDSFGEGILPKFRKSPAFGDVLQGYAGGLSPENVAEELNKIAKVLPEKSQFYLDAEGRLKGEDGHISAEKCKAFINNALQWQKSH